MTNPSDNTGKKPSPKEPRPAGLPFPARGITSGRTSAGRGAGRGFHSMHVGGMGGRAVISRPINSGRGAAGRGRRLVMENPYKKKSPVAGWAPAGRPRTFPPVPNTINGAGQPARDTTSVAGVKVKIEKTASAGTTGTSTVETLYSDIQQKRQARASSPTREQSKKKRTPPSVKSIIGSLTGNGNGSANSAPSKKNKPSPAVVSASSKASKGAAKSKYHDDDLKYLTEAELDFFLEEDRKNNDRLRKSIVPEMLRRPQPHKAVQLTSAEEAVYAKLKKQEACENLFLTMQLSYGIDLLAELKRSYDIVNGSFKASGKEIAWAFQPYEMKSHYLWTGQRGGYPAPPPQDSFRWGDRVTLEDASVKFEQHHLVMGTLDRSKRIERAAFKVFGWDANVLHARRESLKTSYHFTGFSTVELRVDTLGPVPRKKSVSQDTNSNEPSPTNQDATKQSIALMGPTRGFFSPVAARALHPTKKTPSPKNLTLASNQSETSPASLASGKSEEEAIDLQASSSSSSSSNGDDIDNDSDSDLSDGPGNGPIARYLAANRVFQPSQPVAHAAASLVTMKRKAESPKAPRPKASPRPVVAKPSSLPPQQPVPDKDDNSDSLEESEPRKIHAMGLYSESYKTDSLFSPLSAGTHYTTSTPNEADDSSPASGNTGDTGTTTHNGSDCDSEASSSDDDDDSRFSWMNTGRRRWPVYNPTNEERAIECEYHAQRKKDLWELLERPSTDIDSDSAGEDGHKKGTAGAHSDSDESIPEPGPSAKLPEDMTKQEVRQEYLNSLEYMKWWLNRRKLRQQKQQDRAASADNKSGVTLKHSSSDEEPCPPAKLPSNKNGNGGDAADSSDTSGSPAWAKQAFRRRGNVVGGEAMSPIQLIPREVLRNTDSEDSDDDDPSSPSANSRTSKASSNL